MSAPNWNLGQVLSWSGKWHVIDAGWAAIDPEEAYRRHSSRALCGADGYKRDHVPRHSARLINIAVGLKQAPVCKKCERSAAKVASE